MILTDSEVESLKASLRFWEIFGIVSTVAVLIGCIGEYIAEFTSWPRKLEVKLKCPLITKHKVSRLSLIVLTIGVAGELLSTGFTLNLSGSVIANVEAIAAHAEATAKRFEAQIAAAQKDAAESQKEAESERLARVQLQKELEPRRLTAIQKEKLRSLLSDNPQTIMFGSCINGSDDCQDLVNDIGEAFNEALWKTYFGASTRNKRGIAVGFMKGSDELLVARWVPKIRNAFKDVGLSSEQEWFDPNEPYIGGRFSKERYIRNYWTKACD
jgi:hypothetical protein